MATYANALLVPGRRLGRQVVAYGLFDSSGRPLPFGPIHASLRGMRAKALARTELGSAEVAEPLGGRSLYAGLFFPHFGHFLTETLPWLACLPDELRSDPELRLVFFAPPVWDKVHAEVDFLGWFLDRLGIDPKRIHVCRAPTCFETLILSQSPFPRRARYHTYVAAALDRQFASEITPNGKRLYLSRIGRTEDRPRLGHAAEHEALFEAAGFEAFVPETLDIITQMRLICGADVIAGPFGSALHWSLLSCHIREVISLGHRPSFEVLQTGICRLRGQRLRLIKPGLLRRQSRIGSADVPIAGTERFLARFRR